MNDFTKNSVIPTLKSFIKKSKRFILFALNPASAINSQTNYKWYLYLIFPSFGWMLFFMQTGLDRAMEYYVSAGSIIGISLLGFAAGYVTVGLVSYFVLQIMKASKIEIEYSNVAVCIAMSHTYMIFSLVLGFVYRIFGTGSSAAFGVAGLLCTLLPIYSGIRTLGGKNAYFAPLVTTVIGFFMLCMWGAIMLIEL